MVRGRRAGIAAALAIAATAVVSAGCGGGSTSGALQLDPVAAAATKTQDAGAARFHFAVAVGSPQLQGKSIRMGGTGVIDGKSVEMTFGLGSLFRQLGLPSGAGDATMAQLMHASLKEIALEQDGDYVIFMRFPEFLSSQLPGGKPWFKLDFSKLGKSAGVDLGKLFSGSQFNPNDVLSMLEAEGAQVHKVGPATVDGVATTHYHVKIDMDKALKSKGLTSPLFKNVAAQMKGSFASDDVFIAKDGLVRRIKGSYSIPAGGKPAHVAMTMDITDYGAHVTVAAPPSSQVFDATQLVGSSLGGSH